MPETLAIRILAAAIRFDSGFVVSLPCPYGHHDIIEYLKREGRGPATVRPDQQVFVTSDGRFLNRQAALRVAMAARQIIDWDNLAGGLTIEHLW